MKIWIALLIGFSFVISTIANAAIYVAPVEEQVPTAKIVVVGTLVQGKDVDGEHRGEIVVARVLRGVKISPKDKIEVRWKPKPTNLPKGLAHAADYTFAPSMKNESIFVIQPKQDLKKPFSLDWGTQYPLEDDAKIKKLVAKGQDGDFIGKTEAEATALAKKRGIPARVMKREGEALMGTADYRMDRINLTIEKGKVTQVKRG